MGYCERCGREFEAYCGKCREDIANRERGATHIPSDDLVILVAFDHETKLYRFDKEWISLMLNMLHEYDGDNCVKQWCG